MVTIPDWLAITLISSMCLVDIAACIALIVLIIKTK